MAHAIATKTVASARGGRDLTHTLWRLGVPLVLAVGVAGTAWAMRAQEENAVKAARADLRVLSDALETYKTTVGRYPSNVQGLAALTEPTARGRMLDELPLDPWGQPYAYLRPGTHHPRGFDLQSRGPDGLEGTEDDVTNWSGGSARR